MSTLNIAWVAEDGMEVIEPVKAVKDVALLPLNAAGSSEFAARQTWERFRQALKLGRMKEAYECFTLRSQESMTFTSFCGEYGPLTAMGSDLITTPLETHCKFGKEKAILHHVIANPVKPGAVLRFQILLVRKHEKWQLVTEAEWSRAALEADSRIILKQMYAELKVLEKANRFPAGMIEFRMSAPKFCKKSLFRMIDAAYKFKFRMLANQQWQVRLEPERIDTALTTYALDADGTIWDVSARKIETAGVKSKGVLNNE
jgi:hypothetical protein